MAHKKGRINDGRRKQRSRKLPDDFVGPHQPAAHRTKSETEETEDLGDQRPGKQDHRRNDGRNRSDF